MNPATTKLIKAEPTKLIKADVNVQDSVSGDDIKSNWTAILVAMGVIVFVTVSITIAVVILDVEEKVIDT